MPESPYLAGKATIANPAAVMWPSTRVVLGAAGRVRPLPFDDLVEPVASSVAWQLYLGLTYGAGSIPSSKSSKERTKDRRRSQIAGPASRSRNQAASRVCPAEQATPL